MRDSASATRAGECHPAAVELARGADVLVHDAQLFPEELAAEAHYGHAVADYAVELGRRAGVRSVLLFHHANERTDEALDELGRRLSEDSPEVAVATEGTVLEL
jgi:ribonuclease BN (tRNA processing enzyme)